MSQDAVTSSDTLSSAGSTASNGTDPWPPDTTSLPSATSHRHHRRDQRVAPMTFETDPSARRPVQAPARDSHTRTRVFAVGNTRNRLSARGAPQQRRPDTVLRGNERECKPRVRRFTVDTGIPFSLVEDHRSVLVLIGVCTPTPTPAPLVIMDGRMRVQDWRRVVDQAPSSAQGWCSSSVANPPCTRRYPS